MAETKTNTSRDRTNFSKIRTAIQIPNLIEVQKNSYERFLQMNMLPEEREDTGLQAVFNSVFPISDFRGVSTLEFISYSIGNWECKCGNLKGLHHLRSTCKSCGATITTNPFQAEPTVMCHKCGTLNKNQVTFCNKCGDPVQLNLKYDVSECQERGMTYAAPLKVIIRLTIFDKDPDTGAKTIRDIKEQEVYFGEIPLMTENGTFIINGTERVIVSQLHRSPGVFFESTQSKSYYLGKIIPYRGSWVEFEYETAKNILYVRIDRKRKFLGTIFLRALGLKYENLRSDDGIIRTFYKTDRLTIEGKKVYWNVSDNVVGLKVSKDIVNPKSKDVLVHSGKKITSTVYNHIKQAKVERFEVNVEDLEGAFAAADVVDTSTGEVIVETNSEMTQNIIRKIIDAGVPEITLFFPERDDIGVVLSQTMRKDTIKTTQEALIEIYRKLRPGDPPTLETATALFEGMFFDSRKYDFSRVGRLKFNIKLDLSTPLDKRVLEAADFNGVISYLLKLRKNIGQVDDIDHLGNRRVRAVGELLENQFRIGLVRMERAIKEKMSVYQEMVTAMPHDLINAKPVIAAVREFFGSSQLSQFMDQTNPLSEITHKRRLSALGPGGLSRERAGFEVRDVHPTHYGRICPIETPEGPNIGLISSLATYARINKFGFIEAPYRKVVKGRVTDEIEFLSAIEGDKYIIAQANSKLDASGRLVSETISARAAGDFVTATSDKIEYMDVSPKQVVSVATALVPFLEHDDANRALMGSNMQRQAVPLLKSEAPLVGTGMETVVARDSGYVVQARRAGVVESVDATRIVVRAGLKEGRKRNDAGLDVYDLIKFQRSNQSTTITQTPVVRLGQPVKVGQVLADGPAIDHGELALGKNILVAFMPWGGYNFEDAILLSEKLVREDAFTSIHIEEFEVEARDTKLGKEDITRDIPNVGEEALRDLDESGIIRIGAEVKPGNILVGKVTPKGETQLTPEEKLLRAIFGEKAGDVKDTSLRVPPGVAGTVIGAQVFSRRGVEKDERARAIEEADIDRLRKDQDDEIRIIRESALNKVREILTGKRAANRVADERRQLVWIEPHTAITAEILAQVPQTRWKDIQLEDARAQEQIDRIFASIEDQANVIKAVFDEKIARLRKG